MAQSHVAKLGVAVMLIASILQAGAAAATPVVAALKIVARNGKESVMIPGLHAATRDIQIRI
ncbi:hypothetical protein CUJ87_32020 (plasmid) [Paraburkholderia caledonica]|nr:hypothetical protein CUJ87_32020 [Paraburkholderia caledonica]